MSISLLDGERPAVGLPQRRDAPAELAARQWTRQMESELAGQSVCRSIALNDEVGRHAANPASRGVPGEAPPQREVALARAGRAAQTAPVMPALPPDFVVS